MIIGDFLIRFFVFWLKIVLSCVFVLVLQVRVGSKSLEQWIEDGLKNSAVSRYLKQSTLEGVDVMNQKFPKLKGLADNQIVHNAGVVKFYSGFLQRQVKDLEKTIEETSPLPSLPPSGLSPTEDQRLPANTEAP